MHDKNRSIDDAFIGTTKFLLFRGYRGHFQRMNVLNFPLNLTLQLLKFIIIGLFVDLGKDVVWKFSLHSFTDNIIIISVKRVTNILHIYKSVLWLLILTN